MKVSSPTVKKLLTSYKEISLLGHIKAALDWDLNVNMPPKASQGRAEQSAYLANLITNMWLDTQFRSLLEKANSEKGLTQEEKAILRNFNHGAKFYYNVPKEVILKKEKATSEAFVVWREAREKNDFKKFLPHLSEIFTLDQQIAGFLGYKENPYDALLDMYEPGLTAAETKRVFDALKEKLVPLIKKITTSKDYKSSTPLVSDTTIYPEEDQKRLANYVIKKMGFDLDAGRVDVSAHPFTTSLGRYDVRLTTHYKENDFRESFTASMHETGHALYEQGINPEYAETPLEGGVSLGIHEALSRFWENMVGKNPDFLRFAFPEFQTLYPSLQSVSEDDFAKVFNLVAPSFIRIFADEVTYSLHIILRFEMENELINGKIKPQDAAEAWREKSKLFFGMSPESDADGVLQDVHWTYGSIGYFPAYALGNLYGAQFLHAMKKDIQFDKEISAGNLIPIKDWLDTHVHTYGSLYFPRELVEKVTGEQLNPQYFVDYLTKKFSKLYNLS